MKHNVTRSLFLIAASLTACVPAAAQTARRADGGSAKSAEGPASVRVPRYPYEGAWSGTLTLDSAPGIPIAMTFKVADGRRQAYDGTTALAGAAPSGHQNISSAPDQSAPAGAGVARRSVPASAASGGPAVGTPDPDVLADGDHALLLHHRPSNSMLLCDDGRRCVGLATLTWEEKGAHGESYAYSAMLTSADRITGTVKVTAGSGATRTGTFVLGRRKP